jgi:hypothetical protein
MHLALLRSTAAGGNGGCGPAGGIGGFGDGGNGGFGSSTSVVLLKVSPHRRLFLTFLAVHRDRNRVDVTINSKLATGSRDQDDAVALALDRNVTATDLDVSENAVARHRRHTHVRSHLVLSCSL